MSGARTERFHVRHQHANCDLELHLRLAHRLTKSVEPLDYNGVGTTYVYSGNQSMTVTDQLGRSTIVDYNSQGQPMSVQDPLRNPAMQMQYYSPSSDLKSVTDPAGNT